MPLDARTRRCIAALVSLAGAAASAQGQTTLVWNAAANGQWSNPLNWTPNGIPNNSGPNTFNAVISLAGAYTVTLDIDATIQNFTHDGTGAILNLADNADLIVNQTMTLGAEFNGRRELGGQGTLRVNGDLVFNNGARLRRTTNARVDGNISFNNTTTDEICDTGVDHRGAFMTWNGSGDIITGRAATISLSTATTFQINSAANLAWNGLGAFSTVLNQGLIQKSSSGQTFFDRVILNNSGGGRVRVTAGILKVNQLANLTGAMLTGGRYRIEDGGEFQVVDLSDVTESIVTNDAIIELTGSTSRFDALADLSSNTAAGTFTLGAGRTFTTSGSFTNNGTLNVGETGDVLASDFAVVSGSSLTNYNSGTQTLAGGAFNLTGGTLRFDNTGIRSLGATVVLDGAGSDIQNNSGTTAFDGALTVAAAGDFSVRSRTFTTAGDLTNQGRITVGAGAVVEVQTGAQITNISGGTLTGGTFDVAGTLRGGAGQTIDSIAADVTFSGTGAAIQTEAGADALADWHTIAATGAFSLRNGANFTTTSLADFTVASTGRLSVAAGSEFRVRAGSNLTNFAAGVFTGGVFDIRGALRFQNAAVTDIAADVTLSGAGVVTDLTGADAFAPLNRIQTAGKLTVQDRTFSTSGSLNLEGRLKIENTGAPRSPTEVIVTGNLDQTGTLELAGGVLTVLGLYNNTGDIVGDGVINAGTFNCRGSFGGGSIGAFTMAGVTVIGSPAVFSLDLVDALAPPGVGYDQFFFMGPVNFQGGLAGTLTVNDATFNGSVGQVFRDVFVFNAGPPSGFFALQDLVIESRGLALEGFFEGNSLNFLVVAVPAPGGLAAFGLAALAFARRRR